MRGASGEISSRTSSSPTSTSSTRPRSPPKPRVTKPNSQNYENSQAAQKGPDARRRPGAAREAYSLYVERAAEGAPIVSSQMKQMGPFQRPAARRVRGGLGPRRPPERAAWRGRARGRGG